MLDFAQIPKLVYQMDGLSSSDKVVYISLAGFLNLRNGMCNPSIQTISEDCGVSLQQVNRSIRTLRDFGLIEWDGGGKHRSNSYRLPLQHHLSVRGDGMAR